MSSGKTIRFLNIMSLLFIMVGSKEEVVEILGNEYRGVFTATLKGDCWVATGSGCSERNDGYYASQYTGFGELFYKGERQVKAQFSSRRIEPADVGSTTLRDMFPHGSNKAKMDAYLRRIHKELESDISKIVQDLRAGDYIMRQSLYMHLQKNV